MRTAALVAALALAPSIAALPVGAGAGVLGQGEVDAWTFGGCLGVWTWTVATLRVVAASPGDALTLVARDAIAPDGDTVARATSGEPPAATILYRAQEDCCVVEVHGTRVAVRAAYEVDCAPYLHPVPDPSLGPALAAGAAFEADWEAMWDGGSTDLALAAEAAPDGATYVAGSSYVGPVVGHVPLLLRYTASGELAWARRGASEGLAERVLALEDGAVIVGRTGAFDGSFIVERYAADGALRWRAEVPSDGRTTLLDAAVDAQGRVVGAGRHGYGVLGGVRGATEGFVFLVDRDGQVRWTLGLPSDAAGVAFTGAGTIQVLGVWQSEWTSLDRWELGLDGAVLRQDALAFDGPVHVHDAAAWGGGVAVAGCPWTFALDADGVAWSTAASAWTVQADGDRLVLGGLFVATACNGAPGGDGVGVATARGELCWYHLARPAEAAQGNLVLHAATPTPAGVRAVGDRWGGQDFDAFTLAGPDPGLAGC